MFDALHFDEAKHVYTVDGEMFPSVTTIIKPITDAYYGAIDNRVLEVAASRGTAVHNAIELWNDMQVEDIPEEFYGYFGAYKDWFEERKPIIDASELRMFHPILRYAGTCDLLCTIDGEKVLVDYKTSSKVIDKAYRLQMEAYKMMLEKAGIKIDRKVCLHLQKNGKFKEHIYPAKDPESVKVFNACLEIYRYNRS